MDFFTCARATCDNGLFPELDSQWTTQLREIGENPADFAVPYLNHARVIADERPSSPTYGIFVLRDNQSLAHSLFHANVAALPRTLGKTLRINWILNGPRYDYEDVNDVALARLVASIIFGAVQLSVTDMLAQHIKIRLENTAERSFGQAYAMATSGNKAVNGPLVEVRGNWLHFDNLPAGDKGAAK